MDHDGNGEIDRKEFMEFMRDEGHSQMTDPSFFNQLDLDRNGTLDFAEVMTVYYIVKSCRPFCNHYKMFITSTYFTCVGCLEGPNGRSYYLCLNCYIQPKCGHHTHNNVSRFFDNYLLLEAMNKSKLSEVKSHVTRSRPAETVPALDKLPSSNTNSHTWNPSSAIDQVHNQHPWAPGASSTPQNIAPTVNNHTWVQNNYSIYYPPPVQGATAPQRQNGKSALRILNAAVQLAVISSALSSCSIL